MEMQDIKRALAACPTFDGFSDEEIKTIAQAGEVKECQAGENLITEGENGHAAYVDLSGTGDVLKRG